MKIIKTAVYFAAFTCLGVSGILIRMDLERELVVFSQTMNARTVGMGCIVMSVVLYLTARVIGVYLRHKEKIPERGG